MVADLPTIFRWDPFAIRRAHAATRRAFVPKVFRRVVRSPELFLTLQGTFQVLCVSSTRLRRFLHQTKLRNFRQWTFMFESLLLLSSARLSAFTVIADSLWRVLSCGGVTFYWLAGFLQGYNSFDLCLAVRNDLHILDVSLGYFCKVEIELLTLLMKCLVA